MVVNPVGCAVEAKTLQPVGRRERRRLARPAPGCRTHFVAFWSDLDHIMDPLENACVEHPDLKAVNVRVSGVGHLALPVHPAVATGIREALDTAHPGEPSGGRANGLTVA